MNDMQDRTDRRAAERFPVNQDTRCDFAAQVADDLGPVRVQNVSTDGIGLVLTRRVEVGSRLALGVNNAAKGFVRTLLVTVVHVTQQAGASYLVGGTFATPLTYEELVSLVM
jgi:hypothetical protein